MSGEPSTTSAAVVSCALEIASATRLDARLDAVARHASQIACGPAAVLLLDDVLSELDPDRQRELRRLWKNVQIFVTSADPDRVLGDPKGPEERETVRVDLNHKDAEDRWM